MSHPQRIIAYGAAAAALAFVALWYLDPHLMLDLTDALWSCF